MAYCILNTHGSDGDILPFIRIGSLLKKRGHEVTLVSHYKYEEKARLAGISFLESESPEDHRALVRDLPAEADYAANADQIAAYYRKHESSRRLDFEFRQIESACRGKDSIIIARSATSTAAVLASEVLGVPIITIALAPAFVSRMEFDNLAVGSYILEGVNGFRRKRGLPEVADWLEWVSTPKRVFGTWPKWFGADDPLWKFHVEPVGFPVAHGIKAPPLDDELKTYLEKERPVCITGGTGKFLDKQFFVNCIDACKKIGKTAFIVTKKTDLLPVDLPDTCRVVPYLPFESALPYMSVLIHHGGIGTLSEAYAAGIPQLILPKDMDRPDNAGRVKKSGCGDFLPPVAWQASIIGGVLEKLLTPETAARAREYGEKVRGQFPFEVVASYAEDMAGDSKLTIVLDNIPASGDDLGGEPVGSHASKIEEKRSFSTISGEFAEQTPGQTSGLSKKRSFSTISDAKKKVLAKLLLQKKGRAL